MSPPPVMSAVFLACLRRVLALLLLSLVASGALASFTPTRSAGVCSMYGTCSGDPLDRQIDCVANVPAPPIKPWMHAMVPSFCPQWAHQQWTPDSGVCCDWQQASALESRLAQAQAIFARCPACYTNFVFFQCELFCSPNQSLFLQVDSVTLFNATSPPVVNSTTLNLASDWAAALYASCAEVKMASTGLNVMQLVFNATTPAEFIAALGQQGTTMDKSPIQIDANYTSSDAQEAINDAQYLYACDTPDPNQQCQASDCKAPMRSMFSLE